MILSDGTLRELLGSGRIFLDPYDPALVQPASVDVRLGTEFRVMRNSRLTHIDPFEELRQLEGIARRQDGRRGVFSTDELWEIGGANGAGSLGIADWAGIEVDAGHRAVDVPEQLTTLTSLAEQHPGYGSIASASTLHPTLPAN